MILDKAFWESQFGDLGSTNLDFCEIEHDRTSRSRMWDVYKEYKDDAFFVLPEFFLEAICSITNLYAPYDPYEDICLRNPQKIREFAFKLLPSINYLHYCSIYAFNHIEDNQIFEHIRYKNILDSGVATSSFIRTPQHYSAFQKAAETFRQDVIETLLFLMLRITQVASNNKTFVLYPI